MIPEREDSLHSPGGSYVWQVKDLQEGLLEVWQ